jgi:hypothetical protein
MQQADGCNKSAWFIHISVAGCGWVDVLVQVEDIALCEAVQQGLQEPSYGVGRYAPGPEAPMHHFHSLLYASVTKHLAAAA